jgi:hypothetical protein
MFPMKPPKPMGMPGGMPSATPAAAPAAPNGNTGIVPTGMPGVPAPGNRAAPGSFMNPYGNRGMPMPGAQPQMPQQMQQPGFLQNILAAIKARRAAGQNPANPRSWNTQVMPEGAEQFAPQSGMQAISQMPYAKPLLDQFKIG